MSDNDEILFKDEEPSTLVAAEESPWKILIVDDEADVHSVTEYMLAGRSYAGRGFSFLHAYSGAEAKEVLAVHSDMAIVLLDVVMETDDSGLRLVQYIREELKNYAVRIILRTGQPGKAPATQVILDYDIDDYKEKTELTLEKMLVVIISALRCFALIKAMEEHRRGLRCIIEASSNIFGRQSLQKLGTGVLAQLTTLLGLKKDAIYSHASGLAASGIKGTSTVLAATGEFCRYLDLPMHHVHEDMVHSALARAKAEPHGLYCEQGACAWYFQSRTGSDNFLYFETPKSLDENDRDLLALFFTNASLAFDNLFLNKGIEDTQKEIIYQMAETVECRSAETGGHVRRVAELARLLALKYGLGEEEAEMLKLASTLHDLGKIGIPDSVLNKPGALNPEEFEIIKSHVQRGYDMLAQSQSPIMHAAAQIVLTHHERWDGEGYPQGLAGEDIPIHGRIVAVADVFDALSSRRIYHQAWPWEDIFGYFEEQSGKHFDPNLVKALLQHREEFIAVYAESNDREKASTERPGPFPPGWEIRW